MQSVVEDLWSVIVFILGLLVFVVVGGALLYFGGRLAVKTKRITYEMCVLANVISVLLGILSYILVGVLYRLCIDTSFGDTFYLPGLIAALLSACVTIKIMFKVSFFRTILAWLPVLILIQGPIFLTILPSPGHAQEMAKQAVCITRLKGLGTAIEMYHQQYKTYPPSLKEIVEEGYTSPKNFKCLSDSQDREISYFYLPPLETDDRVTFVMCDYRNNHTGKHKDTRNILVKEGTVKELSDEAFQAELAKPHNARFAEALKKAEGQ